MNRRKFLAAGGASAILGASGCLGDGALFAGGSVSSEGPPALELSVARIDDAPEEHGISLDVELASPRLTDDELPALSLRVENVGPRRVTYGTWHRYSVGGFGYSDPEGLVTITTQEAGRLELNSEGCWSYEGDFLRTLAAKFDTVQPGESRSDERHLIRRSRGESAEGGCPEPGKYAFTTTYRVHDDGSTGEKEPPGECRNSEDGDPFAFRNGERVECSFTLELAEVRE